MLGQRKLVLKSSSPISCHALEITCCLRLEDLCLFLCRAPVVLHLPKLFVYVCVRGGGVTGLFGWPTVSAGVHLSFSHALKLEVSSSP
jgi:hypothetical protein